MTLALRYLGPRSDPTRGDFVRDQAAPLRQGQLIDVPTEGLTLGRSSHTSLQVASSRVARLHARIMPLGDALLVTDLGSTNGTQLHGVHASRGQLVAGDRLTLAEEFEFEVVDPEQEG